MTSAEAFKVLGCETGARLEAVTRQYQAQYTEMQVRLDNAPTPQLKRLYQDKLQELEAAYQTLKSLPRTEALDVEVPPLPSLSPLPASPPSPTKPWWVPWGIGAGIAVVVGVVVWVVMQAQSQGLVKEISNSIGMQFVLIPAGEFMMGSNDGDSDERPVHRVLLTKPFYLGKYEVTQGEWERVMGNNNPSQYKGDPRRPVESVSWDALQEFIKRINARESGARYRLPTEAEWEYAARAGSTTVHSFGNDAAQLGYYAWYGDNAGSSTHPVGQKLSNAWGLHDIHGNVWEWVQDWYSDKYYAQSPPENPPGPQPGSNRVARGGSWGAGAWGCRSADRNNDAPGSRGGDLGFRLLSTWPCQRGRFTDRVRVPGPCPGRHPAPAMAGQTASARGVW
jgi:formylglycine-generating enzyme required for sulfatase activity